MSARRWIAETGAGLVLIRVHRCDEPTSGRSRNGLRGVVSLEENLHSLRHDVLGGRGAPAPSSRAWWSRSVFTWWQ